MKGPLSRTEIEYFRSLVGRHLGLRFDDEKLDFLEEVVSRRMAATGCGGFSAYKQRLFSEQEIRSLAEQLTVCETYFFRYAEQFHALRKAVIPERIRKQESQRKLRILSAGCASGEEAYSLAIVLREMVPDFARWEIIIHGVDINASMVKKARRARYPAWSLRETPAESQSRYFHKDGKDLVLDETIQAMVSFEERNLAAEDISFWQPEAFDIVFCRNVTMYFTPAACTALIARIAKSLARGGFLFLGHAETLRGISQDFHLRHTHEVFYYQLRDDLQADPLASYSLATAVSRQAEVLTATGTDYSWFDIIHRASQRIANLTSGNGKDAAALLGSSNRIHASASPGAHAIVWDRTAVMELVQQEKFGEALELLRKLPAEPQADPDAQLLLAVLLTNRGELAEAERICFRLLHRDELNAGAHYMMALCREHLGDHDGAAEHDRAAIYLDPAFAMPHVHLGLLAKRSTDLEAARQELSQALALLFREDAARILLFGGGFTREALAEFCRAQLRTCGGAP